MLEGLSYFMPGLRLIIGSILIFAIAIGMKAAIQNLSPDRSGMLMIIGAPACLILLWVWSGRKLRQQNVGGRRLALNVILAEVCPAIGVLIALPLQKTDDGTPFVIGITVSILFAIAMPLIVLLSYVFRKGRYIRPEPDTNE
ncbi:MAG TPA: hypothetical protein VGK81_09725 [Anaerolineae bacterium]